MTYISYSWSPTEDDIRNNTLVECRATFSTFRAAYFVVRIHSCTSHQQTKIVRKSLTPSVATDLVLSTTDTFILFTGTALSSILGNAAAFSTALVVIGTIEVGALTAGCPLRMAPE